MFAYTGTIFCVSCETLFELLRDFCTSLELTFARNSAPETDVEIFIMFTYVNANETPKSAAIFLTALEALFLSSKRFKSFGDRLYSPRLKTS